MTNETFAQFGLHPDLLQTATELGFTEPTPIQLAAIPLLLSGRDLIGQAQTGTGKTAAFGLPLLQRIIPGKRASRHWSSPPHGNWPSRWLRPLVATASNEASPCLPSMAASPISSKSAACAKVSR